MSLPPLGPIKFLTHHCSGSPAGRGDTAANVVQWDKQRFGQPSYHWVIDEEGNKTRCLSDTEKGAHVALHNTGNIGVCYIGGLDADGKPCDTRTDAQKEAELAIRKYYLSLYPNIKILGHRDWPNVRKACPCYNVADEL